MSSDTQIEKVEETAVSEKPELPRFELQEEEPGVVRFSVGENTHADAEQLQRALGVSSWDMLCDGFLQQLSNATSEVGNQPNEKNMRFALGFIHSIEPQNELETALAAQMAVTHLGTMTASRHYQLSKTPQGRDSAERALNKFARTFTSQMECLKRFRSKAQQVVRVEKVTIEEGAQAVVGHVTHGGSQNEK